MTLEQMEEQLVTWLGEFRFSFDYEMERPQRPPGNADSVRVQFYTLTNKFTIVACTSDALAGVDYLGCIAKTRKPRAGEDWTRGRDLADGPFSRETWNKILVDIVAYETVKIHQPAMVKNPYPLIRATMNSESGIEPTGC